MVTKVAIAAPYLDSFLYSYRVTEKPETLSITEASGRGIADLARTAEFGTDIVLTRHGKPVAAIMSMHRLAKLDELEKELRDAALEFTRRSRRS